MQNDKEIAQLLREKYLVEGVAAIKVTKMRARDHITGEFASMFFHINVDILVESGKRGMVVREGSVIEEINMEHWSKLDDRWESGIYLTREDDYHGVRHEEDSFE